jgi:hypothetical protein
MAETGSWAWVLLYEYEPERASRTRDDDSNRTCIRQVDCRRMAARVGHGAGIIDWLPSLRNERLMIVFSVASAAWRNGFWSNCWPGGVQYDDKVQKRTIVVQHIKCVQRTVTCCELLEKYWGPIQSMRCPQNGPCRFSAQHI